MVWRVALPNLISLRLGSEADPQRSGQGNNAFFLFLFSPFSFLFPSVL